ncbi:unnamed protein product [Durusdinium trenchii]|uniref:Z-binding domain-containing protein n=2 Tax=Durusdinium trenchii TaxID=1381693 RepID=A0ABP0Q8U9_9DINO
MDAMDAKVLQFLRARDFTATLDVAKGIGLQTKAEVNPALYRLEKQGKVLKEDAQKPRWKLAGHIASVENASVQMESNPSAVDLAILQFLRAGDWTATLDVATGIGLQTKAEVNPALYRLEKQGKVLKEDAQKPRWKLAGQIPPPADVASGTPAPTRTDQDSANGPESRRLAATGTVGPVDTAPRTDAGTARTGPVRAEGAQQDGLRVENANPKGQLLEWFGAHAVRLTSKEVPKDFQYEIRVGPVGSKAFLGEVESNKAAAQKSACQKALHHFQEHEDQIPKLAPSNSDFKQQLESVLGHVDFNAVESDVGGFRATVKVTVGQKEIQVTGKGRRKVDAEQFAAQAVLDQWPQDGSVPTPGTTVNKEWQMEALEEQCHEHDKLKDMLRKWDLPNFDFNKISPNLSSCIKQAVKLDLIDEEERRRLVQINTRGNCAKHAPERLRPKEAHGTLKLKAVSRESSASPAGSEDSW